MCLCLVHEEKVDKHCQKFNDKHQKGSFTSFIPDIRLLNIVLIKKQVEIKSIQKKEF